MHLQPGSPGECWEWQGSRTAAGYGQLRAGGTNRYAHRFAWSRATGKTIPPGAVIMHTCDNPPCCNPEHLRLGDKWLNSLDKVAKGRQQRGTQVWASKLDEAKVRWIRANYVSWWHGRSRRSNAADLAVELGVSDSTVRGVVRGATWAWVK